MSGFWRFFSHTKGWTKRWECCAQDSETTRARDQHKEQFHNGKHMRPVVSPNRTEISNLESSDCFTTHEIPVQRSIICVPVCSFQNSVFYVHIPRAQFHLICVSFCFWMTLTGAWHCAAALRGSACAHNFPNHCFQRIMCKHDVNLITFVYSFICLPLLGYQASLVEVSRECGVYFISELRRGTPYYESISINTFVLMILFQVLEPLHVLFISNCRWGREQ